MLTCEFVPGAKPNTVKVCEMHWYAPGGKGTLLWTMCANPAMVGVMVGDVPAHLCEMHTVYVLMRGFRP